MATNALFGWPRWTDKATWSGGSWEADYPLSNLGVMPLARVARSTSDATSSTRFVAQLDKIRPIRVVALCRHNLSIEATVRVRIYDEDPASSPVPTAEWDSGVLDAWPEVYPYETLEWEDDNWWTGTYTAEQIAGYTWTRPIVADRIYLGRWIEVLIDDTSNPAGYVEIGLFEIALGFRVTYNPAFGYQEGWRFRSAGVEAIGGARYWDRRDKPRVVRGVLESSPRDEAMAQFFEMQRQADLDVPLLWFPFEDEQIHWLRTCYLARLTDAGLLSHAFADHMNVPFGLEEAL